MKDLQDKTVLLVDDDPGMLRALDKVLTRAGLKVTQATWVREGISELRDRQISFDLVITDLRMPKASGLTILHAVNTAFPGTPVIIITAYGQPDLTPKWWREQGAAAYLEKPIEAEVLLRTVREVLQRETPASP